MLHTFIAALGPTFLIVFAVTAAVSILVFLLCRAGVAIARMSWARALVVLGLIAVSGASIMIASYPLLDQTALYGDRAAWIFGPGVIMVLYALIVPFLMASVGKPDNARSNS